MWAKNKIIIEYVPSTKIYISRRTPAQYFIQRRNYLANNLQHTYRILLTEMYVILNMLCCLNVHWVVLSSFKCKFSGMYFNFSVRILSYFDLIKNQHEGHSNHIHITERCRSQIFFTFIYFFFTIPLHASVYTGRCQDILYQPTFIGCRDLVRQMPRGYSCIQKPIQWMLN